MRSVNEVNTILEERQQQIEEQSERLTMQTEKLKDQSELLVIKNEELEKLNNTKDKFLSILAHDLKNPFNLLMGFTELLETNYDKLDDAKKMKYIGAINITLKNTYILLENLLQWARSQSDAIRFDPKKLSLTALIKKNLYFFQESYTRKNITLTEKIKNDLYVVADENMLDTVVRNLLTNAIKFTPDGGKITVSCMETDKKVKVEITDTGIGISRDNLHNLFKTDTLITPGTYGETGTGLGLLICHDFVNKNNGEIWVDSEEGAGSTFTFIIPAANV